MISSQLPRTINDLTYSYRGARSWPKAKSNSRKATACLSFSQDYGTEAQCENALFTWRFPNGFVALNVQQDLLSPEKAAIAGNAITAVTRCH